MSDSGTANTFSNSYNPKKPMTNPDDPELRQAILDTMMKRFHITHPDGAIVEYKDCKQVTGEILELFAAELMKLKLPEKLVNTKQEEDSDWFYGYGFNAAIESCQAVIDRKIAELDE